MGALTKAKISPMFVIMMGFLVLFMTGIYPDNVMEISSFAGVASLGQYFLLFNMGTSVDIPTLKCEWRTVLCATVGMAAAILGCAVVIPLIGKEYSMAAAPVVNGGIVATTTMVQACEDLGLDTAAALATFVYAVQKFVGTLPASNCGLSVAKDLVADLRATPLILITAGTRKWLATVPATRRPCSGRSTRSITPPSSAWPLPPP